MAGFIGGRSERVKSLGSRIYQNDNLNFQSYFGFISAGKSTKLKSIKLLIRYNITTFLKITETLKLNFGVFFWNKSADYSLQITCKSQSL